MDLVANCFLLHFADPRDIGRRSSRNPNKIRTAKVPEEFRAIDEFLGITRNDIRCKRGKNETRGDEKIEWVKREKKEGWKEVEPVDRSVGAGRIPKNQRVKRDLPARTNQIWPRRVAWWIQVKTRSRQAHPRPRRNSSSGRSINRGRVHDADLLLEHPRVNVKALSNRTPLFRECLHRRAASRSIVPSCPKALAASRGH